nr:MAG TPA: hypothetical protein [Caudoviricetes sp.]
MPNGTSYTFLNASLPIFVASFPRINIKKRED